MPTARSRTSADIRRELEATEQRLVLLFERWQKSSTTRTLPADLPPPRELLNTVEEQLRHQRGAIDRLHQLWIEYAQTSGLHAPQ